ncbi:MAG: 16S rRNA (guanine(966)-N(2))-methyltransferase RsmD [Candidatus Omnitrophota bacterium]
MRIIAGQFKGRNLISRQGVRPTEDKVKKSLFDILRNVIAGSRFLDLFAGTGAVGIEALSRGAKEVFFVESDSANVRIIQENIDNLKIDNRLCTILGFDVERAIPNLHSRKEKFDFIFLDPPYYLDMVKKTLQTLGAYDIVNRNGFIIVQDHLRDKLPDEFERFKLWRIKKYSTTLLSFYH